MTSKFTKLSGQLVDKFTRASSTLPAHHTDLVKTVSILKNELLSTGNCKQKFESVLDQKGQWLLTSYRDGAGIVELMDQLFPLPHLALQVSFTSLVFPVLKLESWNLKFGSFLIRL